MHTYAQVFYRRYLIASPFLRLDLSKRYIDEWHPTLAKLMTSDGHSTLDGQLKCSQSCLIRWPLRTAVLRSDYSQQST
jgi:hypothetical protein